MKKRLLTLFLLGFILPIWSQIKSNPGYWQQHVDYSIDVQMDVETFKYQGTQKLIYTNNSPDTINRVYFHLYYNAFQPGSDMDERIQNIPDPDFRMVTTRTIGNEKIYESRIAKLKPNEIGYLKVENLRQDGLLLESRLVGTILEVDLQKPLAPNSNTSFTMNFEGQAPTLIRRAGRNSHEGVALSMTQWYPKMAEYDIEGWHAEQYLGREFHSVWGNFDVKITIDKTYTIGGTGTLVNKNAIGHGYEDKDVSVIHSKKTKNLIWHFNANNVLDFAWGADPDFIHDIYPGPNNVDLHFFYKNNSKIIDNWKKLQPKTAELLEFFNENIGPYPYEQYSVIQGGDGGMEYSMCTLITGERSFSSLVSVTSHELAHSWFQHALATNETKYEWMDEGFASFISDLAMLSIVDKEDQADINPFGSTYQRYFNLISMNIEEPLTTYADRYSLNHSYGVASYNKGSIFLTQLSYLIGWENMMKTLKTYYDEYKFTHPTPNDFKRTAEKLTGAVLDWYLVDWTQTTNTIDYSIESVTEDAQMQTKVNLKRIGKIGMPLDILVVYQDDSMETFYIPYTSMHWNKPNPYIELERTILDGWGWAKPVYSFTIPRPKKDIKTIMIDPSQFMADVNQENNIFQNL